MEFYDDDPFEIFGVRPVAVDLAKPKAAPTPPEPDPILSGDLDLRLAAIKIATSQCDGIPPSGKAKAILAAAERVYAFMTAGSVVTPA